MSLPARTRTVLICVAAALLPFGAQAIEPSQTVKVTQLLKTTQTWNGAPIKYPQGQAEVTSLMIEIAPGGETNWHEHPVPSFGILLEGSLEVSLADGKKKLVKARRSARRSHRDCAQRSQRRQDAGEADRVLCRRGRQAVDGAASRSWPEDELSARVMTVSRRQVDNIHVVQIERPEHRNAVDAATARQLADAFREFDADESSDVAILTGAGGHFCAGADLKAYARGDRRKVTEEGDGPMGPTRLRLSKPVIAAVEGYAVAGGCELALWCDLRVASQTAIFGIFCRRFGVPLIDLGTIRLPRLIGHSRAMDLILTGREVRAQEAFDIGLANRLVPAGEALTAAIELARQIASFPRTCMRNDRLSAIEQWGMEEDAAMRNEFRHGTATMASGESAAGASDFAKGAGRHGRARE